jgi:hypothetical protein
LKAKIALATYHNEGYCKLLEANLLPLHKHREDLNTIGT